MTWTLNVTGHTPDAEGEQKVLDEIRKVFVGGPLDSEAVLTAQYGGTYSAGQVDLKAEARAAAGPGEPPADETSEAAAEPPAEQPPGGGNGTG